MTFKNTIDAGTAVKKLILLSTVFSITGCDTLRNTFGLDHYQADEFNIEQNAPLTLPPSYDLEPPVQTEKNKDDTRQNDESTKKAKELLAISTSNEPVTKTGSTQNSELFKKAGGAEPKKDNIRELVDKEALDEEENPISDVFSQIAKNATRISNDDKTTQDLEKSFENKAKEKTES